MTYSIVGHNNQYITNFPAGTIFQTVEHRLGPPEHDVVIFLTNVTNFVENTMAPVTERFKTIRGTIVRKDPRNMLFQSRGPRDPIAIQLYFYQKGSLEALMAERAYREAERAYRERYA